MSFSLIEWKKSRPSPLGFPIGAREYKLPTEQLRCGVTYKIQVVYDHNIITYLNPPTFGPTTGIDTRLNGIYIPYLKQGSVYVNESPAAAYGPAYVPSWSGLLGAFPQDAPGPHFLVPLYELEQNGVLEIEFQLDEDLIDFDEPQPNGIAVWGRTNGREFGTFADWLSTFPVTVMGCEATVPNLDMTKDGDLQFDLNLLLGGDPLGILPWLGLSYKSSRSTKAPSSLGYGWSMSIEQRIEERPNGILVFHDGSGGWLRWKPGNSGYQPLLAQNQVKASKDQVTGAYRLEFPDRSTMDFEPEALKGRLTSRRDRNGNAVAYLYDAQGRVSSVSDGKGRELEFEYHDDGQPRLIRDVRGTSPRATTFEYYEEGPSKGRLRAILDPGGDQVQFTYTSMGQLRQRINSSGVVEVEYSYYEAGEYQGRLQSESFFLDPASGSPKSRNTIEYDRAANSVRVVTEDLSSLSDGVKRETTYRFDALGRLVELIDPLENTTRYFYDDVHPYRVVSVFDPNLTQTKFSYNSLGNLTKVEDGQKNVSEFVYAEDLQDPVPSGHANLLYEAYRPAVDLGDGKPRVQTPTRFSYDIRGNLTSITDAKGQVTSFTRDENGLIVEVHDRRQKVTRFAYNKYGNLESITTPGTDGVAPGLTTWLEYDPKQFDRILRVTNASGAAWIYEYDDFDRLIRTTDPRGHSVSFEYDHGVLKSIVAPPNHGSAGQARRTSYQYSLTAQLEKILAEVTPGGSEQMRARYEYDGFGQLRSLVRLMNGAEKKTTYQYDRLGRHTATTDPLMRTSRTEYSKSCKERTHISAAGRRNSLTMDPLCRVTQIENREGRTTFDYDQWSRVRQVVQPDGRATRYGNSVRGTHRYGDFDAFSSMAEYQYDELDRLVRFYSPPDRRPIMYEYDPEGNVTAVVDAVGCRTEYTYLNDNRLWTVIQDGQTFRYEYGPDGRLKHLHYPTSTSIVADFAWDPAGNLELIHYKRGGVSLHKMKYLYDASGNRSHYVDTPMDVTQERTYEYHYDRLNRLKMVFENRELVSFYDFDESDNRVRMDKMFEGVLRRHDYVYDAADQILGVKRDNVAFFEFTHDRDGNMTAKRDLTVGRVDAYRWNDAGRLVSISIKEEGEPEQVRRNQYDAGNIRKRRIGSDGAQTNFYYSGLPTLTEIKNGAVEESTSYIVGHQVLGYTKNGAWFWFLTDALGSVRALVNTTGDVVAAYTYDIYGELKLETASLNSIDDSKQFLGAIGVVSEPTSGNSLAAMGYRWFDHDIGRFVSCDPIGILGGLNLYAYAGSNPANLADPLGLDPSTTVVHQSGNGNVPGKIIPLGIKISLDPWSGKVVMVPDVLSLGGLESYFITYDLTNFSVGYRPHGSKNDWLPVSNLNQGDFGMGVAWRPDHTTVVTGKAKIQCFDSKTVPGGKEQRFKLQATILKPEDFWQLPPGTYRISGTMHARAEAYWNASPNTIVQYHQNWSTSFTTIMEIGIRPTTTGITSEGRGY